MTIMGTIGFGWTICTAGLTTWTRLEWTKWTPAVVEAATSMGAGLGWTICMTAARGGGLAVNSTGVGGKAAGMAVTIGGAEADKGTETVTALLGARARAGAMERVGTVVFGGDLEGALETGAD